MLTANALYWLDRFHVDGLRVDAVASMLYLDYSRKPGEWLPNPDGSNENHDAVAFLQQRANAHSPMRRASGSRDHIAEESTSWPGVSQPVYRRRARLRLQVEHGLDARHARATCRLEPIYRRWHHDKVTFGLLYAFSENFVLPLSHDEVVHGKGSILSRMPGDDWQQFANVRAYYGFMWGQSRQEAAVHGPGIRPAPRMEPSSAAGLASPGRRPASIAGVQRSCAT
jgi:1,4-alpha-glucan branching enzyme